MNSSQLMNANIPSKLTFQDPTEKSEIGAVTKKYS